MSSSWRSATPRAPVPVHRDVGPLFRERIIETAIDFP
jgi:hypothetical protein